MPQYTATAFRWSGTGYNAVYNTSYTATFDDNDPSYEGGGDGDETISINGGAFGGTSSQPYAIDVSFTDTNSVAHVETFYFFNTGGFWYFVPGPSSAFTVGATLGSYQSHTVGWDYADITCFCRGTLIETKNGPKPVEDLRAGDLILTGEEEFKPLRKIWSRKISKEQLDTNEKLRPIRIRAGRLGNGKPERDLLVSRQHRMVIDSKVAHRMFKNSEVLVAAIRLTKLPGIQIAKNVTEAEYFHLLFDQHEIVFAEGAPSESLFAGGAAFEHLLPEVKQELADVFPEEIETPQEKTPARHIPRNHRQNRLIARHRKNQIGPLDQARQFK